MATMPSSGAIAFSNLNSVFGGSPVSISAYYRGGGRVPSSTTSTTTLGPYYNGNGWPAYAYFSSGPIYWDVGYGQPATTYAPGDGSYTTGGFTYTRGSVATVIPTKGGGTVYGCYITRSQQVTTSVNTGVPSSGTISMSQFYGATS